MRKHLDADHGTQADLRVTMGLYGDNRVVAGVYGQATWASSRFTQAYYGIDEPGLLYTALGFGAGHGVAAQVVSGRGTTLAGVLLALVPVMFTYSGWNAAAYVAEEVRNPGRNVPLALGLGTAAVVLIYLGLNALYLYAIPAESLAAVKGTLIDSVAESLADYAGKTNFAE